MARLASRPRPFRTIGNGFVLLVEKPAPVAYIPIEEVPAEYHDPVTVTEPEEYDEYYVEPKRPGK